MKISKKEILEELELEYLDFAPPGRAGKAAKKSRKAEELERLYKKCENCRSCALGKSRNKLVFGEGSPESRIVFVGEAPGLEEDKTGRPFIGRAGKLLTDIIENGMKIKRKDVYIANIVKCHPMKDPKTPEARGNDRPPADDEMNLCGKILEEQIKIIKPAVIVALGSSASQFLLKTDSTISSLRGNWQEYNGMKLMPTFHPSYLLRNPSKEKGSPKHLMWQDIKKVLQKLEK